jgi:hypothetical protein
MQGYHTRDAAGVEFSQETRHTPAMIKIQTVLDVYQLCMNRIDGFQENIRPMWGEFPSVPIA